MNNSAANRLPDRVLVAAVIDGDAEAWSAFVERTAEIVHGAAAAIFPIAEAESEALDLFRRLADNGFVHLRAYDGRATLATFLQLKLADLLVERSLGLLATEPERGWAAFALFFDRDIKRVVARHFPGDNIEDPLQDVRAKLIADDYKRLRAYSGHGSFTGFLRRTVGNICIDLQRAITGRRRLPAAIENLDQLAQIVFREIYWNGVSRDALPQRILDGGHGPEAIEAAVAQIDALAAAGAFTIHARPIHVPIDDDRDGTTPPLSARLADEHASPEAALIEKQQDGLSVELFAALETAMTRLPDDARLYLQLRFLHEPPLAPRDIASLMNIDRETIYRRREAWEAALRGELVNLGVENIDALSV